MIEKSICLCVVWLILLDTKMDSDGYLNFSIDLYIINCLSLWFLELILFSKVFRNNKKYYITYIFYVIPILLLYSLIILYILMNVRLEKSFYSQLNIEIINKLVSDLLIWRNLGHNLWKREVWFLKNKNIIAFL